MTGEIIKNIYSSIRNGKKAIFFKEFKCENIEIHLLLTDGILIASKNYFDKEGNKRKSKYLDTSFLHESQNNFYFYINGMELKNYIFYLVEMKKYEVRSIA